MTRGIAEPVKCELADGFTCFTSEDPSGRYSEIAFIHREVFVDRCYVQHGVSLPPRAFVVDAGANVGMFSLFASRESPGARVLAFEPVPHLVAALRANLELHDVTGVEVFPFALGSAAEQDVEFTFYPRLPGNSTRYRDRKEKPLVALFGQEAFDREATRGSFQSEGVTAEVRRLSDVLSEVEPTRAVDLLKVDVEGAEHDVLLGLDDRDWARVRQVVAEVHDVDGALGDVTGLLRGHGFTTVEVLGDDLPEGIEIYTVYATRKSG